MAMDYDDITTTLWTARQAAEEAHVSTSTIRSWVRRGHLEAADVDEHGWPLYRALDVIKAEHATRERAHRRYIVVPA
jgi:DNA-binding transcriptional MerR regulator